MSWFSRKDSPGEARQSFEDSRRRELFGLLATTLLLFSAAFLYYQIYGDSPFQFFKSLTMMDAYLTALILGGWTFVAIVVHRAWLIFLSEVLGKYTKWFLVTLVVAYVLGYAVLDIVEEEILYGSNLETLLTYLVFLYITVFVSHYLIESPLWILGVVTLVVFPVASALLMPGWGSDSVSLIILYLGFVICYAPRGISIRRFLFPGRGAL